MHPKRVAVFATGFLLFLGLNVPCYATDRCNNELTIAGKTVNVWVGLTEYPAAVKAAKTKESLKDMGLDERYLLRTEPGAGESSVREDCAGYVIRRVWDNPTWRYKASAEALLEAVRAIAGDPLTSSNSLEFLREGDIVFYGAGDMKGNNVKHVAYVTKSAYEVVVRDEEPGSRGFPRRRVPAIIEGKDNDGPYVGYGDGVDTGNDNLMSSGGGKWGDQRIVFRPPGGRWPAASLKFSNDRCSCNPTVPVGCPASPPPFSAKIIRKIPLLRKSMTWQ